MVSFTDLSTNNPTTWMWSFPGGTPSSSTVKNPANVVYTSAGLYSVILIVSNEFGADTLFKEGYINVSTPLSFPVLNTESVRNINANQAICGGNITDGGGSDITARGVCWSTNPSPIILDSKTSDGSGTGVFVSNISGLTHETTYYVRAYATNSSGTRYGAQKTFKTLQSGNGCSNLGSPFTDIRDGHIYDQVTIGSQIWMAENLNYASGGSWCYNNSEDSCKIYGRLYSWTEATGVCPAGWHLPSDSEWLTLVNGLGGTLTAGGSVKATTSWFSPNTGAINSSCFSALPGGYRDNSATYGLQGYQGHWWTSTEFSADFADHIILSSSSAEMPVPYGTTNKVLGFSVRCIKD